MFGRREPSPLDKEITRVTRELDNHIVSSEEYVSLVDQLIRLHKLRNEEKSASVSQDTLVLAGTNLLGILMIISYEHKHVITSKALPMIQKPR
jgi:nitrate/nitrite-specific signal transduction histidine kinase